MEKTLGRRSSIILAIVALVLLLTAGVAFLVKVPASIGGAIETNAAPAADFQPGPYSTRINVRILNDAADEATAIGALKADEAFTVYETRHTGSSWYGRIAQNSDNWVVLQDANMTYVSVIGE